MSSERLSRALMEVGEGFGKLASYNENKEIEATRHLRDMSMQRLRGQQQMDVAKYRVEEARLLEEDRRAWEGERDEVQHRRLMERQEAGFEYQDRRLKQQRLKDVEAQSNAELKAIDVEIGDARAMLDKAGLEGTIMDDEKALEIESRIELLRERRMLTSYKKLAMLRELGDERYENKDDRALLMEAGYSAQEIEMILSDAAGGKQALSGAQSADSSEDSGADAGRRAPRSLMGEEAVQPKPRSLIDFHPKRLYGSNV